MTENPTNERDKDRNSFLDRVVGQLRLPEFVDESFGERVMGRVRREAAAARSTRPRGHADESVQRPERTGN